MSRRLLELLLTFGVPLSIRGDAGAEFTAQVVKQLCQWLRVSIYYGPLTIPERSYRKDVGVAIGGVVGGL